MNFKRCSAIALGLLLLFTLALPMQTAFAQTGSAAQGGIFDDYQVQPEGRVEVPIEIRDVEGLYAIDIQIAFDPAVVQVEDANPSQSGVQPALGTFLDAGLTLFNEVDNETGLIRFVMTQANPSEAKSGDGVVLVLYLTGVRAGESDLEVTFLELSTRAGEAIEVEPVSGIVTVSADAVAGDAASIPVQDSAGLVPIPTVIPTEIPTPAPTTASDAPEAGNADAAGDGVTEQQGEAAEAQAEAPARRSGSSFSLVEHWWIVLIVVGLVIGLGIFLGITRR
jgi:hypothetical protein